jgi:hypothetical protein
MVTMMPPIERDCVDVGAATGAAFPVSFETSLSKSPIARSLGSPGMLPNARATRLLRQYRLQLRIRRRAAPNAVGA